MEIVDVATYIRNATSLGNGLGNNKAWRQELSLGTVRLNESSPDVNSRVSDKSGTCPAGAERTEETDSCAADAPGHELCPVLHLRPLA